MCYCAREYPSHFTNTSAGSDGKHFSFHFCLHVSEPKKCEKKLLSSNIDNACSFPPKTSSVCIQHKFTCLILFGTHKKLFYPSATRSIFNSLLNTSALSSTSFATKERNIALSKNWKINNNQTRCIHDVELHGRPTTALVKLIFSP